MENATQYADLVEWEIWNFMSIEHAVISFDEKHIVNIKGYNNSGKSAALLALKVLCLNSNPAKQKQFIRDNCDYFRVIARFADGVSILRDKYSNGQSLYEMYKNNTCIYSTKTDTDVYTKITDVPEPIKQYLGLIMYEDTCLNARSCIESQLGVSTNGGENYKLLNAVLKCEELAQATTRLNEDKNKKANEYQQLKSMHDSKREIVYSLGNITLGLITLLKNLDSELDAYLLRGQALNNISDLYANIQQTKATMPPELSTIDLTRVKQLGAIQNIYTALQSIKIAPELETIDDKRLTRLLNIKQMADQISSLKVAPKLDTIDTTQVKKLLEIQALASQLNNLQQESVRLAQEADEISNQLQDIADLLGENTRIVKCPNCGQYFEVTKGHTD